jgi:hypothetical protein
VPRFVTALGVLVVLAWAMHELVYLHDIHAALPDEL